MRVSESRKKKSAQKVKTDSKDINTIEHVIVRDEKRQRSGKRLRMDETI